MFDVVQVVGETAGSPYSNLVQKGELRTYVVINGKRIDYLNRYIKTSNETSERIRIPIPRGLLKTGKNVLRIEQTGMANDPTSFDDLGILQVALQFSTAEDAAPIGRPAQPRNHDGGSYEDADAQLGPARPRDRPRSRRARRSCSMPMSSKKMPTSSR